MIWACGRSRSSGHYFSEPVFKLKKPDPKLPPVWVFACKITLPRLTGDHMSILKKRKMLVKVNYDHPYIAVGCRLYRADIKFRVCLANFPVPGGA